MAAPRATQFIALRNLSRGSHLHHHNHQHVRALHMTGPTTYASPILTQERSVLNLPNDISGLRAECKKRQIDSSGSKHELRRRLDAHELSRSRAFSTAAVSSESKRPSTTATTTSNSSSTAPQTRHINTSRALKANNDTSTIDFFYLPDARPSSGTEPPILRVPILPTNTSAIPLDNAVEPHESLLNSPTIDEASAGGATPVMKPQIIHVAADNVYLPMAELTDGHAMNVDFHKLADRFAAGLKGIKMPVEQQAGFMKQIFGDLVDDVLGVKTTGTLGGGKQGTKATGRMGTIIPSG